jgi:hypothetical protein
MLSSLFSLFNFSDKFLFLPRSRLIIEQFRCFRQNYHRASCLQHEVGPVDDKIRVH